MMGFRGKAQSAFFENKLTLLRGVGASGVEPFSPKMSSSVPSLFLVHFALVVDSPSLLILAFLAPV